MERIEEQARRMEKLGYQFQELQLKYDRLKPLDMILRLYRIDKPVYWVLRLKTYCRRRNDIEN